MIDEVCTLAYNYSLSLFELGQFDLSEEFMSKAMNMIGFTSEKMNIWRESVEVHNSQLYIILVDSYHYCLLLLGKLQNDIEDTQGKKG